MRTKLKLVENRLRGDLHYHWPSAVYDNRLNHPSEIANYLEDSLSTNEELLGYYTNMLQTIPEHKEYFDFELRSRDLDLYIAPEPQELAYYSDPSKFSRDLIMEVVEAKSFNQLLSSLRGCYGDAVNARLCAALLIAICLGRDELATAIKGHINKLATFSEQARSFIEANATEAMAEHILKLYAEYLAVLQKYKNKKQATLKETAVHKKDIMFEASSSALSPYQKMDLFNQGQRRENLRACSDNKLINYYNICLISGFKSATRQITAELLNRDLGQYVCPDPVVIDSTQFTPYEAQFVKKFASTPEKILEAALQHPMPGLTVADTLTLYLVWAIALGESQVVEAIKKQMASYGTYYSEMPKILNEIIARPGTKDTVAKIIKGLPI